ncbi:MAG: carboxylate-amine ligase [Hyphomicrobiaceae bacterium]|nr:carboxylate-amine ligase [Hyphomicrobiaceae bacterium]
MTLKDPAFTVGIEEEYLLVDRASRDLVREIPPALFDDAKEALGGQVSREFLKAQIEVGTRVHATLSDAGRELSDLRQTIAACAARHGLAMLAAATHPFANWKEQEPSEGARYQSLAQDLAGVSRRMVICGMHVHVGVEDDELRIDLMNQARYFLPHLLVLSTSSPFAEGQDTGLKSYRLAAFQQLPRTGLPQWFDSWGEYRRTVEVLVRAGVIGDATKIWWDLRPSARFPTLEMRITDVATDVKDATAVAALFVAIVRMLYRIRRANQSWRDYPLFLLAENRWRAQRYGVDGSLFDFGKGELVPFRDLLEELLALVREDAMALGCVAEVERTRHIAAVGTSADRQIATFKAATAAGASGREAMIAVVDQLIAESATPA